MSEPKLISPMLDNYAMGAPISDHHGVRCCPAMDQDSGNKYIVKILSIPASQVQLDALLLTGAYPDEASALGYFKELSEDVIREVEILKKLSDLEGFVAYENSQIIPMDDAVGYDVYLLGPYRRSLEAFFRKNTMTHLAAVNLGLDMCAALAVSRQAGYLYIDLKPENIFISQDQEYRIGDLGFVRLDSLNFASLPDKYRSAYTAPEIADAFATISTTADVYAAGMILYQAYNGGVLPFEGSAPAGELPAPLYADYEMAEIILKACDPDPVLRWKDPIQMGQALVSYMQRNGANDTPIVPAPVAPAAENSADEAMLPATEETDDGQIFLDVFSEESPGTTDMPEPSVELEATETAPPVAADEIDISEENEIEVAPFLAESTADETIPSEDTAEDISYEELSEDITDILTQADELIAHEAPEPVVAPGPVEIIIPEPAIAEDETEDAPAELPQEEGHASAETHVEEEVEEAEQTVNTNANVAEEAEVPPPAILTEESEDLYDDEAPAIKFSGKKILAFVLAALLLAGLIFAGYIYYRDCYLQTVTSLTLAGNEDQLRVSVTTEVDESLLSVVCIDTYGNKLTAPVVNGVATFTGLNPNTLYSVKVEISGLRRLTGEISDSYSTPVQTNIVTFNAVTGNEEGTAIISFTVDGADGDAWSLLYTAEGEDLQSQTFTGHIATITGLTLGKTYSFTLDSDSDLYLTGLTQLEYTAIQPVLAEDLTIQSLADGNLDVIWTTPEGTNVGSWIVRCYNEGSYSQVITVADTAATFTGLDPASAYTIEVTAEGMSSGARTYLTANAVSLSNATAEVTDPTTMNVSWSCENAPSNSKWLVIYNAGGNAETEIIRTSSTSATLSPIVPGADYTISIQLENGTSVIGGTLRATVPPAATFDGHALGYIVRNTPVQFSMCLKPDGADWTYNQVNTYSNTFIAGQKAAFVAHIPGQYNTPDDTIITQFIIRDENGVLVSAAHTSAPWRNMWYRRYCELDVPTIPNVAGNYTIEIYFNGLLAHRQDFSVTA